MQKRDFAIDVLRTIGILMIILAHVNPPSWIFQLRNFDVPFMVILSGYLYSKATNVEEMKTKYVIKRFKRLVVPVWFFLTFIFMGGGVIRPYPFNLKQIITSYGLWSGIGYVWIIRIYLIVAILGPWTAKKLLKRNYLLKIIVSYILWEILIKICLNIQLNRFIIEGLLLNIPYVFLFSYGANFKKLSDKKIKIINIFATGFLFVGTLYFYFMENKILNFQNFKYPPRLYYIFYALLISNILLANKEKFIIVENRVIGKLINFIGNSTMWIYLWHIPPVILIQLLNKKGVIINYIFAYFIVCLTAFTITFIQQNLIRIITERFLQTKQTAAKNLKVIFIG